MFSEYENSEQIAVISTDGNADYFPNFLDASEALILFEQIKKEKTFRQNEIFLFGKKVSVPRLEAYYSLNGAQYGYSGQQLKTEKFPSFLNDLRLKIERKTGFAYNALLINYYRNGADSNGWHADDEKVLGANPSIASLSLGATRIFELKHTATGDKKKINLTNGSLLHMYGALQHHFKHQLPKMLDLQAPRLNLTFRWVQPSN
jgi:alkylated DNA repair dioxygenase AlkB